MNSDFTGSFQILFHGTILLFNAYPSCTNSSKIGFIFWIYMCIKIFTQKSSPVFQQRRKQALDFNNGTWFTSDKFCFLVRQMIYELGTKSMRNQYPRDIYWSHFLQDQVTIEYFQSVGNYFVIRFYQRRCGRVGCWVCWSDWSECWCVCGPGSTSGSGTTTGGGGAASWKNSSCHPVFNIPLTNWGCCAVLFSEGL